MAILVETLALKHAGAHPVPETNLVILNVRSLVSDAVFDHNQDGLCGRRTRATSASTPWAPSASRKSARPSPKSDRTPTISSVLSPKNTDAEPVPADLVAWWFQLAEPHVVEASEDKMANKFVLLKDNSWGIRGQGLVTGETVKVEKSNGPAAWLKVGNILSDRNGFQTSTIDRSKTPCKTRTCSALVVETVVAPEPPPIDDADLNWEM